MKRVVGPVALFTLLGVLELSAQSTPSVPVQVVGSTASGTNAGSGSSVGTGAAVPAAPTVVPTVVPATPTVLPGTAAQARLVNLSTRARVTAANPLITGFVISGTAARAVLVRAAGPGLAAFGVTGALAAPRLQLRDATGALVVENAGWGGTATLANTFAQAGAFPFAAGSADSAAVVTLAPGTYTVQVLDASGGSPSTGSGPAGGVALAEVYDLGNRGGDSRLVNVSTRTTVAAGGGELISGFVLDGTAPRQFLVRGIGPALSKFGVSGILNDPVLTLFDSTGRQVAANNDWSGNLFAAVAVGAISPAENAALVNAASAVAGAFALDFHSTDAAFVTTLVPGAYTVQVTGASVAVATSNPSPGATNGAIGPAQAVASAVAVTPTFVPAAPGVALLEIYELP